MWQPTHVKVTVKQAKNLITKGKNGTNDVFVVIGIGKEKYQTSIKEKAGPSIEWREECELAIPSQGNKAAIQLTVYHHNSLGLDEFLGQVAPLLSDFDVYEKPKYRNYKLKGKPEKDKKKGEKERGELEIMVNFTVKSGSFLDISKKEKHKSSIASLKHIGGSLMSIGSKEKQGFKNFAKSVSSKMDKIVTKPKKKKSKMASENSVLSNDLMTSQQKYGDADPGVISDEDDDFRFDDDIKVYTTSSSPQSTMSRGSSLMQEQVNDTDFDFGSYDDPNSSFSYPSSKIPPKPPRIVIDETKEKLSTISNSDVSQSFNPTGIERITSFSDPKPASGFKTIISTTELTDSTIKEESSLELKSDIEVQQYMKQNNSAIMQNISGQPNKLDVNDPQHVQQNNPKENEYFKVPATAKGSESFNLPSAYHSTFKDDIKDGANNMGHSSTTCTLIKVTTNVASEIVGPEDSFTSSYTKDGDDSAISVSNDNEQSLGSTTVSHPRSSSNTSSAVSSLCSSKDDLKMPINEVRSLEKTLIKSSSAKDVTLRTGSVGNKRGKRIVSAAESWSFSDSPGSTSARASGDFSSSVIRSGSLSEKRSSEPVVDEWERKLYGRTGINGSTENIDGSRSSLNSRTSSTQDIRRDDSFTRLPEVKALTLEKNQISEEVDEGEARKQKKHKGIAGFKQRLFHNKNSGGSREKLNEDSRIVEGGNDRMPLPPTRSSRLPQEIHDKFTGKSREDLLETILSLQSSLERQAKHSHDLEDYIDNLLLRVMEINPHILQAPISKKRAIKGYGPR